MALGAGQAEAKGRILISPRMVNSGKENVEIDMISALRNQSGERQILILDENLKLLEALPLKITQDLMPITYLSMDSNYIYAFGKSAINKSQLLVINQDSKEIIMSLDMPISSTLKHEQNFFSGNAQQTTYRFERRFSVENLQIIDFEVVSGEKNIDAFFTAINSDGEFVSYSISLDQLIKEAKKKLDGIEDLVKIEDKNIP